MSESVIMGFLSSIFSIIKANLIILGILIVTYIIEVNSNFKLFIDHFKWKKSIRNAEIAANGNTIYYLIFCLAVFVYDMIKNNVKFNFINILFWLIIMTMLTFIFHRLYSKYQGVDPNKADDDYT